MALSGGQKQRLAVATAILSSKYLLVFDEPTSGLDYDSMVRVSRLIEQLSASGVIVFVVSHDFEFYRPDLYGGGPAGRPGGPFKTTGSRRRY